MSRCMHPLTARAFCEVFGCVRQVCHGCNPEAKCDKCRHYFCAAHRGEYDGLSLCGACRDKYVVDAATDRARERVALCIAKADLEALLAKIENGNADAHGVYEALQAASLRLILGEAV